MPLRGMEGESLEALRLCDHTWPSSDMAAALGAQGNIYLRSVTV